MMLEKYFNFMQSRKTLEKKYYGSWAQLCEP